MDSGIKAGDGTELCGVVSTAGKGSLTGWRSGTLQTLWNLSKAKWKALFMGQGSPWANVTDQFWLVWPLRLCQKLFFHLCLRHRCVKFNLVNRMRAVMFWFIPWSQSKSSWCVLKSPQCCWFIAEGSQLKPNAEWLPRTACHFEYMELWKNWLASLFLQLFLSQNMGSLTAVKTFTSELGG